MVIFENGQDLNDLFEINWGVSWKKIMTYGKKKKGQWDLSHVHRKQKLKKKKEKIHK